MISRTKITLLVAALTLCATTVSAQEPDTPTETVPEQVPTDVAPETPESMPVETAEPPKTVVEEPSVAETAEKPIEKPAEKPEPVVEAAVEATPEPAAKPSHRFVFGSYGRVIVASDLEGGSGENADFVAHSPRVDEQNYVELELRREDDFEPGEMKIVATLALAGPLFHYDGDFQERVAIRNLYAQFAANEVLHGLKLWAGSRMVRGDDIYLLDFWPLDNLNLLGGGTSYDLDPWVRADVNIGLARPNDPFQLQTDLVTPRYGFGAQEITIVDRPRTIGSAKLAGFPLGRKSLGFKVIAYGEQHALAEASGLDQNDQRVDLPQESGQVFGGQLGFWWSDYNIFANIFARHATGLASVDPLSTPSDAGAVRSLDSATETTYGFSLNAEYALLGLQAGGYVRSRKDGEDNPFEGSRSSEGVIAIRPHVWIGSYLGIATEVSYQALRINRIDEVTGIPVRGEATKFAVMPFLSPAGRGTYTRPHIRLIYAVTTRSEESRLLFAEQDPRARQDTDQFFGIGAEWWFESSSYE